MKESQKIYIKGNKERGDEIKEILTGLGASPVAGIDCNNEFFIYYIDHDNKIALAVIDSEVGRIIMDNYKEIFLPPRPWKDGDILAVNHRVYRSGIYAVFRKYAENNTFDSYILFNDEYMRFGISFHIRDFHLVHEVEKEDFNKKYDYMMSHLKAANDLLFRKDMR